MAAVNTDAQEQEYRRAITLVQRRQNYDEACDQLRALLKTYGDYRSRTQFYMDVACPQAERERKREEAMYREGLRLLQQEKLDQASARFDDAGRVRLKNRQYTRQIEEARKQIERKRAAAGKSAPKRQKLESRP